VGHCSDLTILLLNDTYNLESSQKDESRTKQKIPQPAC